MRFHISPTALAAAVAFLVTTTPVSAGPLRPRVDPGASPNIIGAPSMPAGYAATLFREDFSTLSPGSLPPSGNWAICTGTSYPGGPANWGNGESQTYTRETTNLAVTDSGTLRITPQRSNGWTSGRIETTPEHDFSCAPNQRLRIEARLKLHGPPATPEMAGIWPAFWSLGSAYRGNYRNWPTVGEIDVLENVNGAATAWHTIHCGSTAQGGPCRETNGIGSTAPLSREEWHTVAVEIDRASNGGNDWAGESMAWIVDGAENYRVYGRDVADQKAWASLAHEKRFLLLNVAVGGSFPDAVFGGRTPSAATRGGEGASMEVAWVAVYST
jgi:beta-glucanase (GH16 family)